MSAESSDDTTANPTAEQVAEFLSAQIGAPASAKSSEREFLRRLAIARERRRNKKRIATGAVIVSGVVLVVWAASRLHPKSVPVETLSYRVVQQERQSSEAGPSSEAGEMIAFSDGSQVRMEAQASGRIKSLSNRGAIFFLEHGTVAVDIVPRPGAQWTFEAGPFRVNVHGTSFTVAWSPVDSVFELRLNKGSVSVTNPIAASEIDMRTGQVLKVSLRDRTSSLETMSGREKTPAARTTEAVSAPLSRPSVIAPSEPSHWTTRGWAAALAQNKSADIVAEADRRGVVSVLERADTDDLWALANAARFVGRYALATQSLHAYRKRFPTSHRSPEAAFLLGRLHDDDQDSPDEALRWYDRSLMEMHDRVGVSDALGRKMTLLQRWNRAAEAVAVARDYLRRFPQGTYANAAQALIRSSTAVE